MSLAPGTRLGPYEILTPLGAGGMGEVYRARDTRLARDVAIKILPEAFSADPERLARFEREAKTLASLNHPHIAQIYGLEANALVMELVDGEDLASRINRGAMPIDEALPIARQIADALEAAHERGIVHRDLKPANVMLTAAGDVKVLDFGLAKASIVGRDFSPGERDFSPGAAVDPMNSPTITSPATKMGMILGTAAYMAPEQAKGKAVDKRADIWAFGVVLYEMLTGRRPFVGETMTDVIAAIVTREPDWSALPPATPRSIRDLLARCLDKDPRRRLRDVGEARLAIERADAAGADAPAIAQAAPAWRRALPWALALAAIAFAGVAMWRGESEVAPSPVYATLDAPSGTVLGEDDYLASLPTRPPMVFTPDGQALILQASRDGQPQLYLRSLGRPDARPIAGTEGAHVPFVSPDGKWVGFWAANELRKVSIEGGEPVTICALRAPLGPNGAVWAADNFVVFGDHDSGRLMRVSANGGEPTFVTAAPPQAGLRQHVAPFVLPGDGRVLFSDVSTDDARDSQLMVQSLDGGDARLVVASATDGRVLPSGDLAFMRLGTLMTVPFDLERAIPRGEPVAAMSGVMQSGLRGRTGALHTGAGMFAVSSHGALAVVRGAVIGADDSRLRWIAPSGEATSAEPGSGVPAGGRLVARLSPDGSRALVDVQTPLRRESWIADWVRNVWTPCERCGANGGEWSPDGLRVVHGENDTLVAHTIEGTEPDKILLQEKGRYLASADWLADDRIVYLSSPDQTRYEIKLLEPGATAGRVLVPLGEGNVPHVSPDGQWLAYATPPPANVIVQAFPGGESRTQISAGGGTNPLWSADGRTLYYLSPTSRDGSTLWAVDIGPARTLTVGSPRELFRRPDVQTCLPMRCYDISPAGPRFLMRDLSATRRAVSRMDLVLNWTSRRER